EPGPSVPPELAGTLVPWDRLLGGRIVCDDSCVPVRRGRNIVTLEVRSNLERSVYHRAKRRSVRRRWRNGSLELRDMAQPLPRGHWIGYVLLLVLGAAFCWGVGRSTSSST